MTAERVAKPLRPVTYPKTPGNDVVDLDDVMPIDDRCPHYGFQDLSRCGICCGVDS